MILFLSGCSIYKSDGRKQFESDAPQKVKTSSHNSNFQLQGCKKETALESWFNEEFPSTSYELVVSENDLEIWRTTHPGSVEVKALQKTEGVTQSCTYQFSSKEIWDSYQESFIRELENNLLTQDDSAEGNHL